MFDYQKIDEYQLEITSYCNAACPQCPRNNHGIGINKRMPLCHLNRQTIDRAFTLDLCARLRQIFFCGSYGDPIMHPDFLDILRDFRKKNPTLWLYFHTNGGVHDPEYWAEIAHIMAGYGQIDFGIDGLENTLHLYRKNVSYNKVIENATAFINAGGRAQWNFIVFGHNENEVEKVQQIGKQLGFFNVLIRKTGRFLNHRTLEEIPLWPVNNGFPIEPPTNPTYRNQSIMLLPDLKKKYGNIKEYFNTTKINCDALLGKKVVVTAEGLVLPCNFFTHNLYDQRFYEPGVLPESNELSSVNGENQVRAFLESYNLDSFNINLHSLEEIFANPMWQDLVASWNKTLGNGRLFECAMTCGSKFTKVWDQGGNKKIMKYMITGGNRGLGADFVKHFNGDSYSRSNGYDINKDIEKIAQTSLDYDVFINNAFDGPFQEEWADFGQVKLLYAVADLWSKENKIGHIINIGSSGSESVVAPIPNFETYRISKSALKEHSRQWTRAFKENKVPFKTSLLTLDRIATELTRSRPTWTGNGINTADICHYIETIINSQPNTCIEEIIAWVNFDYK
jgi:MoaA/NifB/PqqE/SkfB family radical SAM enzyme